MTDAPAYRALALQARCVSVNRLTDAEARAQIKASIDRIAEQVAASVRFIGPDCTLVVLPEYVLTGHPVGEPIDVWRDRAALEPDGPEEQALGAIARDNGLYLAANCYERDPGFPDLYFQASLIFGPDGGVALRYRRLNSLMTVTPHDVLDRYLELYGEDALFPVARTPIGALACIASEEILFPELARCLALRGAEVFCHSTSEVGSPLATQKDIAKRARAIESLAYVVSANSGGIDGSPIPGGSTDGGSQVVDFEGRVLVQASPGESMVASAELDLAALRRARARPGMGNLLSRVRLELYAPTYANTTVHAPNGFAGGTPDKAAFVEAQRAAIRRLVERGVIPG